MKLASLEIMFCKDAYDLLLWFKKVRNLNIPSREDFQVLMDTEEVQTLGVWFDHVGLVSILKINRGGLSASWGLSQISFPVCAEDVVRINSGLSATSYEEPPKITLWLKPDTAGNRLTELEARLVKIGFVKDFAYNWDFTAIK